LIASTIHGINNTELIKGCCLSLILFKLYSEYLTREALEGSRDFNTGGQVIRTVKYSDDFVLLAEEEMVLQGRIDRLIETGRCCGMEMYVEKEKVMRISRLPSPVQIAKSKRAGECGTFQIPGKHNNECCKTYTRN
jgi:hypothetical protein